MDGERVVLDARTMEALVGEQGGDVLAILVQKYRHKPATKRFFHKPLKGVRYSPRVIVTDKLRSYAAAKKGIMPGVMHRLMIEFEPP